MTPLIHSAVRRTDSIPLSERLSKSKSIPDQARALAQALKQAVVQPLRRSIRRRKESENGPTSGSYPAEFSIESTDSTSPIPSTPPVPVKAVRQTDDSDTSSSIEISVLTPPAKPPRHFSLYREEDLIEQTDAMVKRVWNLVENFPSRSDESIPNEISEFADDLAKNILRQCRSTLPREKDKSHLSQSIISMHISPVQKPLRPLMVVSHERPKTTVSPILDIVTSTSTPFVTTSVRVTSPSALRVSSDTTVTIVTGRSSSDKSETTRLLTSALDNNDHDDDDETSTVYESAECYPSSTTSPSYVSAVSTFYRSGTVTPTERRDSQRTENDYLLDLDRLSQGRPMRWSHPSP